MFQKTSYKSLAATFERYVQRGHSELQIKTELVNKQDLICSFFVTIWRLWPQHHTSMRRQASVHASTGRMAASQHHDILLIA